MSRGSEDRRREETLYCVDRRSGRTSRAFSLLFQSWLQMGAQAVVGSARIMADTLQDLNDLYCDPRGGPDGRGCDEDERPRRREYEDESPRRRREYDGGRPRRRD
ncbi:MAG TPA: hypothetical protein VF591_10825 [Pyrinomonadaceae bacterium]